MKVTLTDYTADHLATMRFAYATFHVEGISRICSHQIVRMSHAGILQRSQRYVSEKGIEFVRPHTFDDLPWELADRWTMLEELSRGLYEELVSGKHMKKEDARYVLLHSAETSMHLCSNFQGFRDFLRNRNSKHAQEEVRQVAIEIQKKLHLIAPLLFDNPVI